MSGVLLPGFVKQHLIFLCSSHLAVSPCYSWEFSLKITDKATYWKKVNEGGQIYIWLISFQEHIERERQTERQRDIYRERDSRKSVLSVRIDYYKSSSSSSSLADTRIFLTCSHHPALLSIAPGRSSKLYPVAAQGWCKQFIVGWPNWYVHV